MVNVNTEILKVPLGFIRCLELPLVIIAFAAAANYGSKVCYSGTCSVVGNPNVTTTSCATFGYPLALKDVTVPGASCKDLNAKGNHLFHESFTSQSQFFVFVGVMSMLYVMLVIYVYTMRTEMYETDSRLPLIDLVGTGVLAFFWFCGSCAFAAAITGVKKAASDDVVLSLLNGVDAMCSGGKVCIITTSASYGGIVVAAIAGFGCFFIFTGNVWFVLKETAWFKERNPPPGVQSDPAPGQSYP